MSDLVPTPEQIREADAALGLQPLGRLLYAGPIRPLWHHLVVAYMGRVWESRGEPTWLDYIRRHTLVSTSWARRVAQRVDDGRYRLIEAKAQPWEGSCHG